MVTYIMRKRSFSGREQDNLGNYVEDLDILQSLTDFQNSSSEVGGSVFGCYRLRVLSIFIIYDGSEGGDRD